MNANEEKTTSPNSSGGKAIPKQPLVVHCQEQPYDVYIGRPGKWGNPFRIGPHGTREECVEKYREWINQPEQAQLREQAKQELRGKVLGCWCKTTTQPERACHGDVLVEIANNNS